MGVDLLPMNFSLRPEQAEFIQTQIVSGRCETPEDAIERALSLLAEWEKSYYQWLQETHEKVYERLLPNLTTISL